MAEEQPHLQDFGPDAISDADINALAMILLPETPYTDMDTLAGKLGIVCETNEKPQVILDALKKRAAALSPAMLQIITGLLQSQRCRKLNAFFDSIRSTVGKSGRLGKQSILSIVQEIPPDAFIPVSRPAPPEAWQPLSTEAVNDVLGQGGQLQCAVPNYECREGQLQMANAVVNAFNGSSHLLVEAGTGTGKSLAYLVPAIQWALLNNVPVVISTNTKNLQSQLFEKDIPLIRSATGLDFQAALIKGRSNYLCLRKLIYLLEHADFELRSGQHELTASVLVWITRTQTGDLSEAAGLDSRDGSRYAALLSSSAEECSGRSCRYAKQCFLRRVRARSMAADLIVANHSLVFAEMKEKAQAIPPHAHLILDEAHNLEDAATRYFSVEVSKVRIHFLLRRLGHIRSKERSGLLASFLHQVTNGAITGTPDERASLENDVRQIQRAAEQVEQDLPPLFFAFGSLLTHADNGVRRLLPEVRETETWRNIVETESILRQAIAQWVDSLGILIRRLENMDAGTLGFNNAFIQDFDSIRCGLVEFRDDLAFMMDGETPGMVFWVEADDRTSGSAKVISAPIDVGERLCESLYLEKQSIIFTSATLSVRGNYHFLMNRLGLDRVEAERLQTLDVGTPFDYSRQAALMVPMFLPDPAAGDQTYETALADFLAALFRRTGGRGLALFTSYTMLQKTTVSLRESLHASGIEVLAQGESASREHLTERFRSDVSSVLMGTHSFWEGVDAVGETLSCVVLARLPFAVFTDPIVAARCEALEAAGQSAFTGYSIPNAVIRFRQGFGRLIRHRTDRGLVIVADHRMMTKRYGHWFRGSVPVPAIKFYDSETMLDAVARFLEESL